MDKHKSHFCYFCHKEVKRIHEHMLRKHAENPDIKEVVETSDKNLRFWLWKRLTQKGDNLFNAQIRDTMAKKRIVKELTEKKHAERKKYYTCKTCYGRIRTISKYRHQNKCQEIFRMELEKIVGKESNMEFDNLFDLVTNGLDEVASNRIRKSLLLSHFIIEKSEEKKDERYKGIKTLIRDLIKLEDSLRKKCKKEEHLILYYKPCYVDDFIRIIKDMSGEERVDGIKVFKLPYRAQRLCRTVLQLANFLKTFYSKRNKDVEVFDVTKFLNIFEPECVKFIKNPAHRSIKLKKIKNAPSLPKTSDIQLLIKKLKEETPILIRNLKRLKDSKSWRQLAENLLCRLTIFNRRRGGAVEKLQVKEFKSERNRTTTITEEAEFNISEDDKKFLKNVIIIELIHKCHNNVPIFITSDILHAMNILLSHRRFGNINERNEYFFAASRKSLNPISGVRVLENYRSLLPKEIQKLFTATNLRKHGATTAQVLDLSQQDTEEWARHMGHNVEVHKRYYRYKEQTNSILKTGRILTALDQGTLKFYKGRKINEISLKPEGDPNEASTSNATSDIYADENTLSPLTENDQDHLESSTVDIEGLTEIITPQHETYHT